MKEKEIKELLIAGILDEAQADRIKEYYASKQSNPQQRQLLIFGSLGAILAGIGVSSIIAHNWDDLGNGLKLFFAFLPMAIGQVITFLAVKRGKTGTAWLEGGAVFLLFAIGAALALVSQIYQIPGEIDSYLLTWSLLVLPLIYLSNSRLCSLFYLIGITVYGFYVGYGNFPNAIPWWYLLLFLAILPFYLRLFLKNGNSNFTILHHWFVAGSLALIFGTFSDQKTELLLPGYFFLFASYYLIGQIERVHSGRLRSNAYMVIGSLGMVVLLLTTSFSWYWEGLVRINWAERNLIESAELVLLLLTGLGSITLLIFKMRKGQKPTARDLIFVVFGIVFLIGLNSVLLAKILINLSLLLLSVSIIKRGVDQDNLGILNYGLFIITALISCRFFDTDISFIVRGLLFLGLGAGFFYANYRVIRKRKPTITHHEE